MSPQPPPAQPPAHPDDGRPDFVALDERHRASRRHVGLTALALVVMASGEYAIFHQQLSRLTGESDLIVVCLTVALVLFVQLSMHFAAMSAVRRRNGLALPGLLVEGACVLMWLGVCAASCWLRLAIPPTVGAAASGQQTTGTAPIATSPGSSAAAGSAQGGLDEVARAQLVHSRFAWLCLALALGAGVAAYAGTALLYRPRTTLLRAAEAEQAALDDRLAPVVRRHDEARAVLPSLAQAQERAAARRDQRKADVRLLGEEAAERARLRLIEQLANPTDTTRVTRAPGRLTPAGDQ